LIRCDRLALFSHVWALATLCDGVRWIIDGVAWGWPLTVAAGIAVLHPRRAAPFVVMMLLGTAFAFFAEKPKWTPNHTFFMALANLVILAALWREAQGLRGAASERAAARERALERIAPSLVWMLVAFYAFAVLHKLNADFFDAEVSCAADMYGRIAGRYGFLPPRSPELGTLVIWGTIATEALIPVLLVLRPARLFGVLLGIGFHFVLAQYPRGQLCSFASMLYAIYFLCLPRPLVDELTRQVDAGWAWLAARASPRRRQVGVIGLTLVVVAGGAAAYTRYPPLLYDYCNGLWNLWVLAVLALGVRSALRSGIAAHGRLLYPAPRSALGVSMIGVVIFVGLNPYLGLRTETSWSMFSNLRTEIRSNHFFVPEALAVFSFQRDLVEILESDDPYFQRLASSSRRHLPWFEMRRRLSRARDISIRFHHRGQEHALVIRDGRYSDPGLDEPAPWLLEWWLHFRPVDADPRMRCSH
jgi:hypothetical protein